MSRSRKSGKTRARGETVVSGADIFTLYDTFGFPPDMTGEMAGELGLGVDEEEFNRHMEGQRTRSRTVQVQGDVMVGAAPWKWIDPPPALHSEFVGYDTLETPVVVVARRPQGEEWEFLLDVTPFYAEGGGQVADRGWLVGEHGFLLEITNVQKQQGDHGLKDPVEHVHRGRVVQGDAFSGTRFLARVDIEARRNTERNHTATHLLHAALKRADHAPGRVPGRPRTAPLRFSPFLRPHSAPGSGHRGRREPRRARRSPRGQGDHEHGGGAEGRSRGHVR
jgi:alanyl-tRNA synthetase